MRKLLTRKIPSKWSILITLSALVVFVGAVLVLSGCSNDGMLSDVPDSTGDDPSFFDQPYDPGALAKRSDISDIQFDSAQAYVRADEGGMLVLGDDANVAALVFLPGSVSQDTLISVEITSLATTAGETPVIWDFKPDGLQFSRPTIVRLNAAELFGTSTSSVTLYWLNEATHEWEPEQVSEVDSEGVVCLELKHFSSYAAGEKNGDDNVGSEAAK
ncbi:MAG: hypothetical protein JSW34_08740 [Candidatus Zixiibacteriota bacterium]|nr:MAG: hypothetical protein JSW34_08740 [candidate division Zixibacteria bacterium]